MRPPRIRARVLLGLLTAFALVASSSAAGAPSAPATAPAAKRLAKVTWAPPKLVNPITIRVPDTGSIQGEGHWPHVVTMDPGRDYILRIGHRRVAGGLALDGGRNVVVVGGRITIPRMSVAPSPDEAWRRTCMTIKNATGVIHVEGVLCDGAPAHTGSGSELTEGIDIQAPRAKAIQLQNVRIEGARSFERSGWTDNHPNILQCWACPPLVRIDGLTGESDYEGIQLCHAIPGASPPKQVHLRRVNVRPSHPTLHVSLWPCDRSTAFQFEDVYIHGGGSMTDGRIVSFGLDQAVGCRVSYDPVWHCESDGRRFGSISRRSSGAARYRSQAGDYVFWPDARDNISGAVRFGDPPGGDFVRSGTAGRTYRAPGYR